MENKQQKCKIKTSLTKMKRKKKKPSPLISHPVHVSLYPLKIDMLRFKSTVVSSRRSSEVSVIKNISCANGARKL